MRRPCQRAALRRAAGIGHQRPGESCGGRPVRRRLRLRIRARETPAAGGRARRSSNQRNA
ncbi:hypothetical protein C7S16_0730 [Burkholderia thailandensis]|uniref:Uncharacterized protein n=1 Tax=Burkholderia thailandensis TaxID=57975 RepID=A0AAW9D2I6_BURTH|nr:hypothetical protein [Burkholderia thailandensis]MDW9256746.1 hypothetical protein [Burkholderia thailandensis]